MHIEQMQYAQSERQLKKTSKEKRIEWLKAISIPSIVENVKDTLNACGFFEKYGADITESKENIYLEVSIVLDQESYTVDTIMDALDESFACSYGIGLDREYLHTLASYYYENFYNENMQRGYYITAQEKRNEYENRQNQ